MQNGNFKEKLLLGLIILLGIYIIFLTIYFGYGIGNIVDFLAVITKFIKK